MFFVDGATTPSIQGTGSEDYFLGAWDFGYTPFSYQLYGAPVVGQELAGSRSSAYRFHFDSPIPFTKSFKATIEHGNANHRSDNYYSVAYWYQSEPHDPFPPLPSFEQRLPKLQRVGGPGNFETGEPHRNRCLGGEHRDGRGTGRFPGRRSDGFSSCLQPL